MLLDADAFEFERAKSLLLANIDSYVHAREVETLAWRRRIRDRMEYGSLLATAAIMQELSRTPSGEKFLGRGSKFELLVDGNGSACLAEGVKYLAEALEETLDSESIEEERNHHGRSRDVQFMHGAKLLGATNLIEAYTFAHIVPGLQDSVASFDFDLSQAMSTLESEIERGERTGEVLRPIHSIVYWRCFALLTDQR